MEGLNNEDLKTLDPVWRDKRTFHYKGKTIMDKKVYEKLTAVCIQQGVTTAVQHMTRTFAAKPWWERLICAVNKTIA